MVLISSVDILWLAHHRKCQRLKGNLYIVSNTLTFLVQIAYSNHHKKLHFINVLSQLCECCVQNERKWQKRLLGYLEWFSCLMAAAVKEICVQEQLCACVCMSLSVWLTPRCYCALLLHNLPQYLCMFLGIPEMTNSIKYSMTHLLPCWHLVLLEWFKPDKLCVPPGFQTCKYPAISVDLNTTVFAYQNVPCGSLLCLGLFCSMELCLFFFLFFFMCISSALYCCVSEAQGREGLTMHCGSRE